ncbi:MAG: 2,3-bisphosphoglycerate-independent phosphoglycerate mutase [Flavobacteriaceae bacterium]|nr:2,3-bisphosphoglycerate-independent phosphoglycerate mutase [Flavobacteriaceae bacterium]
MNKKVLLLILDGWGIASNKDVSAPDKANTPNFNNLLKSYPNNYLITHGDQVGLPHGQMGNSEVGHMNIGSGRIVLQDLLKINDSIEKGEFHNKEQFEEIISYSRKNSSNIHLIGLLSDGGVHSHIDHLKEIIISLSDLKEKIFIHAFTDGRDVDPKSGINYVKQLENFCKENGGNLATLIGRYFSMDRDNRWDRIYKSYDLICNGNGKKTIDFIYELNESYNNNITDEFIEPIVKTDTNGNPIHKLRPNDTVIFFNYRSDRGRQLTSVLCEKNKSELGMETVINNFYTLTNYNENFKTAKPIFKNKVLKNTLGEVLSKNNIPQLRIAETEKYPHVTFFFNGGYEEPFKKEKRILCPSPKVATYDLKPEMSAGEVSKNVIEEIKKDQFGFICLNFANPDMVGHTGNFNAAIKACESVDSYLGKIVETANQHDYVSIIIADHGNCEKMMNTDGSQNTSHTINPVPIIIVNSDSNKIESGILADIAPTILDVLGIKKPEEMNGKTLLL